MIFSREHRNPNRNPNGGHSLYAAVDHLSLSDHRYGHQLVSYDLTDLKGGLPYKLFNELQITEAWRMLMLEWRSLTETDAMNIDAFKKLLKD